MSKRVLPLLLVLSGLAEAGSHTVGPFTVQVDDKPLRVSVAAGGRTLLPSRDALGLLKVGRASATVKSTFGKFSFDQDLEAMAGAWDLASEEATATGVRLSANLRQKADGPSSGLVSVTIEPAGEGTLALTVAAGDPANRLWISYPGADNESFLGLGERYDRVRQDGRRLPVWTSEQGIGRSNFPILPFTGNLTDTYFPVPFYMSSRGHGVLVDSPARTVWDFRVAPRQDRVAVEVWDRQATLVLFDGPRPADVLRRLTARTGRPRPMPDWAFGVWLGAQGGPAKVLKHLENVRGAGAPVDVLWCQDWLGGKASLVGYDVDYHWSADLNHYPDLGGMIAKLHAQGIKFMGYFNTFIEPRFPEFAEVQAKNWLVTDASGKPWTPMISTFRAGLLDITNPAAQEYMKGKMREALKLGLDGWMSDFGEWLPWDGRVHGAGGAPLWHNRYPVEWARITREACLAERPNGDFVIFARSGFAHSAKYLDLVWAGDQNTSWKADDGLPSVIPAGLSLGLSGVPLWHFDAGGYTSLVSPPRNEELFMRWVEAAACSPTLRTHEGYWAQQNIQADSNPKVLAHFTAMAKLHRQLQPRIIAAAKEATATGLPLMRHLWLQYPEDPATLAIEDQYFLGPDLLVAPVIKKGAQTRKLYVPRGSWKHVLTGAVVQGPAWTEVAAPIGQPPVFERQD